jgi:hypothetical protein
MTTSDRDLRRAKFDLVLERQRWILEEPWNRPYLPLGSNTPNAQIDQFKKLSILMKQRA